MKGGKACRDCTEGGVWDTMINVDECRSAGVNMLSTRLEDIMNATDINATELSAISEELSIITDTSGVSAILPEDLNTTNDILATMIRLDFLNVIKDIKRNIIIIVKPINN